MVETTLRMRHTNGRSIEWTVRITRLSPPFSHHERFTLDLAAAGSSFRTQIEQFWSDRRMKIASKTPALPPIAHEAAQAVCVFAWIAGSFSFPLEDALCPDLDAEGPASAGVN